MTITDSRPRHLYRLPDGSEVPIIFDHGEAVPLTSTCQLAGGEVVPMTLVATADNLTDEQIAWFADACFLPRQNPFGSMSRLVEIASRRVDDHDARRCYGEAGIANTLHARGIIADAINAHAHAKAAP